jgi:hypothetical protein
MYHYPNDYNDADLAYYLGEMVHFANEIAKDSEEAQELAVQYNDAITERHYNMLQSIEQGEAIHTLCKCVGPLLITRIQELSVILQSQEAEDQEVAYLLEYFQMYRHQWLHTFSH